MGLYFYEKILRFTLIFDVNLNFLSCTSNVMQYENLSIFQVNIILNNGMLFDNVVETTKYTFTL